MFTNNYINIQKIYFGGYSSPTIVRCDGATCGLNIEKTGTRTGLGSVMGSVVVGTLTPVASGSSSSLNTTGIRFGSGSTAPTKEDYTLESPIESGLTVTNGAYRIEDGGDGKHTFTKEAVLRNTTESDIVIREIGVFGVSVTGTNAPFSNHLVLLRRDVLSSPVVIAPGESKLVSYKMTFNQPA